MLLRTTRSAPLALLFALAPGCALVDGVEVAWSAPALSLDIDAERAALERALCADVADAACAVLTALDAHDGLPAAATPTLPALMPRTLSMAARHDADANADANATADEDAVNIDVATWLDVQRRDVRDFMPALSLPFDGIDADQLAGTRIVDASLRFDDDLLALDLPALDITVDDERIGMIAPHVGGSGDDAPLSFVDGGVGALQQALAGGGTVRLVAPEGTASLLQPVGDQLRRPGGSASLVLDLRVAVSAERVLAEASR